MKKFRFSISDSFGEFCRYIEIGDVEDRREAFRRVHDEMKYDEFVLGVEEITQ